MGGARPGDREPEPLRGPVGAGPSEGGGPGNPAAPPARDAGPSGGHALEPGGDALPRLMLVTDRHATGGRDLADVVSEAVAGGVGLVQVRERDLPVDELERLLHRLLARLHGAPARLLVNGSPTLAHALGIGLHLAARVGPLDGPRPRLYGRAVHDEAEARRALAERVSHVVAGPVYPTRSKPGHPGLGASGLAALARAVAPVPLFAIGGLTPERVAPVVRAGAHGVAVRGAILGAATPRVAARDFTRALARAGTAPGGPGAGR